MNFHKNSLGLLFLNKLFPYNSGLVVKSTKHE